MNWSDAMEIVRCIYLEDVELDRGRYADLIKFEWNKLETGVPITVVEVASPEEAIKQIRRAPCPFDIFIVDLMIEGKEIGLNTIKMARDSVPSLAIVSLSGAKGALLQRSEDVGADGSVAKDYVHEQPERLLLAKTMLAAFEKHGIVPLPAGESVLAVDEDDLDLVALLDEVGRPAVIALTERLIRVGNEKLARISPHFVGPGFSGAAVLRVECSIEQGSERPVLPIHLLLKVSRSRDVLERELNADRRQFPDGIFVTFREKLVSSQGWNAISTEFQENSATLGRWVGAAERSAAEVSQVLERLFLGEGLQKTYSRLVRAEAERPNTALFRDGLTLNRRSRIRKTIRDLGGLARKHDTKNWFNEEIVLRFIGDAKRIDNLDEEDIPRGVSRCWSHGDLHGNNILVKLGQKQPVLIDPANAKMLHWALDLARLTVDLAVSTLDSSDSAYEWERMWLWQEAIGSLIRHEQIELRTEFANMAGVVAGLNWVTANWSRVFLVSEQKWTPKWEFVLALGIEFLRASLRLQDLPTPKRVLSLLAACEAIREAARQAKTNT